jgi:acetyl-CoA C-acetyltransferase
VVIDSMAMDGLEDAYAKGTPMGVFAEDAVKKFGFTRKDQDDFALASLSRAVAAINSGAFEDEIVPVEVTTRAGVEKVSVDEQPGKAKPEKIPSLKPAFVKDGTVTAANASSISDGAAALVMMRESVAKKLGAKIVARVVATGGHSHEPSMFTSAPVPAMKKVMAKAGWSVSDVDLFEVNEAFAVVAMIAMKELNIPHDKLNVNGGACALGHPIGASGARIVATLLAALKRRGLKRGVAGICIGGGEATAMAVELV